MTQTPLKQISPVFTFSSSVHMYIALLGVPKLGNQEMKICTESQMFCTIC